MSKKPLTPSPSPLREVLVLHYLAGIDCDHATGTDRARCGCSCVALPVCSTVGEAVDSWIDHVVPILVQRMGHPRCATEHRNEAERDAAEALMTVACAFVMEEDSAADLARAARRYFDTMPEDSAQPTEQPSTRPLIRPLMGEEAHARLADIIRKRCDECDPSYGCFSGASPCSKRPPSDVSPAYCPYCPHCHPRTANPSPETCPRCHWPQTNHPTKEYRDGEYVYVLHTITCPAHEGWTPPGEQMADGKCDEHVPLATAIALCTGELDEIAPGSEAGDLRRAFNHGVQACIEAFRQYTPQGKDGT